MMLWYIWDLYLNWIYFNFLNILKVYKWIQNEHKNIKPTWIRNTINNYIKLYILYNIKYKRNIYILNNITLLIWHWVCTFKRLLKLVCYVWSKFVCPTLGSLFSFLNVYTSHLTRQA